MRKANKRRLRRSGDHVPLRRRRAANLVAILKDRIEQRRKALELVDRLDREIRTLLLARRVISGGQLERAPEELLIVDHGSGGFVLAKSDLGRAISALRRAGHPLHVEDMIEAIKIDTGTAPKKHSLVGALARVERLRKHVYRAGPNTFGLLAWRADQ